MLQLRGRANAQAYPPELRGWCSSAPFEDKLQLEVDGVVHGLAAKAQAADVWAVRCGGDTYNIAIDASAGDELVCRIGDQALRLQYCIDGEWIWLRLDGRNHRLRDLTYHAPQAAGNDGGDGMLRAPMNGKIAALPLAVGQVVQTGQTLVVLEAMKMEHAMIAPFAGVLQALHVSLGEQVAPGKILLEIARS